MEASHVFEQGYPANAAGSQSQQRSTTSVLHGLLTEEKVMTGSKTQELVAAAKKRQEIERTNQENTPVVSTASRLKDNLTDEELDTVKAAAEEQAEGKVQAKAGTIDGTVDIEAMGDVKGDGGDAKDYDDGDPAKALGVPVYEHGLAEIRGGVDTIQATETRLSKRTALEQARGKELLEGHREAREKARAAAEESDSRIRTGRTFVTEDADEAETIAAKAKADAAKAKAKRAAETE
jgi:hypothetical protein